MTAQPVTYLRGLRPPQSPEPTQQVERAVGRAFGRVPSYDRDDLLQEAALVVLDCRRTYHWSAGPFERYVARALHFHFVQLAKREQPRSNRTSSLDVLQEYGQEPLLEEPGLKAVEDAALAKQLMSTMTERQRRTTLALTAGVPVRQADRQDLYRWRLLHLDGYLKH